jgi:uncharacterized protein YcbK (DUF882 family)
MLIKIQKGQPVQITNHFSSTEFECPCTNCTINYVDDQLVNKLEDLRVDYGSPIRITSGYRCPKHNEEVGGVSASAHQSGLAADIQPSVVNVDELDKLYDLAYISFDNIGDGRRLKFVHLDVRPSKPDGKKRTWTY